MASGGPRGPLPKANRSREKDEARRTYDEVELGTKPVDDAPKLTDHARRKLHRESRRWWDVVASCPQASQFGPTDWQRIRMVILPLVDRFNRALDADAENAELVRLAKAISDLEAEFGLTPASRLRLRWKFRQTPSSSSAEPAEPEPRSAHRKRRAKQGDARLALVKAGS